VQSIQSTGLGDDEVAHPLKIRAARGPPSIAIKYAPLSVWFVISGMRRTGTYEAIGRGDLRAIKLNGRTLIDVEHGLAYMARLPEAQITTGRRKHAQDRDRETAR
jgi:hypothetical protein